MRQHLVGAGMYSTQQIKLVTGRDEYLFEFEDMKKSDRANSAGHALYVDCIYTQWFLR